MVWKTEISGRVMAESWGEMCIRDRTNDAAGDGTTTATLLAQALVREGMKNIAAGANPMVVKKGIEKAVAAAVESIRADVYKRQP